MSFWRKSIQRRFKGIFTRDTAILLVCVLIASIFWLLTKLSNHYTSDIQIPVVYSNMPEGKVLRNELPEKLTLYVNASGWELVRHYLNLSSLRVIINAQEYSENGKMLTNSYRNVFSQQLQDKFEVQRVLPQEIAFEFYDKGSNKVPVKLRWNIDINPQYGLADNIRLTPDSVTVTGPAPVVDSLQWVATDTLRLTSLKQTATGSIALKKPAKTNIELSENQVEYEIPVAQYTETHVNVPITVVNAQQDVILLTREAQVSFQVPVDDIKKYEQQELRRQFSVVADFREANPADSLVPVQLTNFPQSVRNVSVSPKTVSFLFLKR